ncbi:hypothetical protein [Roseibium alexandrii]|uniref:Uncharacterized protein n=2 Tax=Roseibium alexandrii TaxID=388408 RepID=A0A0M7AVM3_9HYPH|nr:hypothetical protein [Roseibium alexandrii]EEE43027.2 hypothetical protein SADFL11_313 [Roseibium alexandrii DFL-11]CTQ77634.1 hypothetical protein LAX5112_04986 [Roseibium alexandrii]
MPKRMDKDSLFKAVPQTPVTKAEITKKAAQDLAHAETEARRIKTEKLKKARLEQEVSRLAEAGSKPKGK